MRRTIWLGLAFSGLFGSVVLAQPQPVASGQERRIAAHAQWDGECRQRGLPTITVVTPPSGGRIELRTQPLTVVGRQAVGRTSCEGAVMPHVAVWYVARAGFRGPDRVDYTITYGSSAVPVPRRIDVLVE